MLLLLMVFAYSHYRQGQDKSVMACPCRRCEQAITHVVDNTLHYIIILPILLFVKYTHSSLYGTFARVFPDAVSFLAKFSRQLLIVLMFE